MSSGDRRGYHFASEAQWAACLPVGIDLMGHEHGASVAPLLAFGSEPAPAFATNGAWAPASTRTREILWRDRAGALQRVEDGDTRPRTVPAPAAISEAWRAIANGDGLWVPGLRAGTLERFDLETLSRQLSVDLRSVAGLHGARVEDLAADDCGGVLVLVALDDEWQIVPVGASGEIGPGTPLEGMGAPQPEAPPETGRAQITWLRDAGRLVVLSRDGARLLGYAGRSGAPDVRIACATLGDCFRGRHLASDPGGRVFVAGMDEMDAPVPWVVVLDAFGVRLGRIRLAEPATGLAGSSDALLVAAERGLYLPRPSDPVPASVGEIEASIVTPMLGAPEVADGRRWLRIEATASLPPGTSLEILYATSDDESALRELRAVEEDLSLPEPLRAQRLRAVAGVWSVPFVFQGSDARADDGGAPLAIPLHDVRTPALRVAVALRAGPGARRPILRRLSVLYPGRTLMERLPSPYRREESEPGSFTRTLVGVLETTTQDLDARIAEMGRWIHPEHADGPWLDYLARWLDLPWDDSLEIAQKRCIVRSAARIIRGRGTRAGLEALLACLLPGDPRPYRVIDVAADLGFAIVGDRSCQGSAISSILAGSRRRMSTLDRHAILGRMHLACEGPLDDDPWSPVRGIRIDIAASAQQRRALEPWLPALAGSMVPATVRTELRWVAPQALHGDRIDDALELGGPPDARLGDDAVLGVARLPEGRAVLSESGPTTDTRLH